MLKQFRYYYARLKDNSWWVGEYEIKGRSMNESGLVACHGKTAAEALEDATAYVKRTAYVSGEATIKVRRPNFFEKLFG